MPELDWDADVRAIFPDWQTEAAMERWSEIKGSLRVGQTVTGKVISMAPFGVWLDINIGQPALLLLPNMDNSNNKRMTFDDYPPKEFVLETRVNALGDTGEIGLTQHNPDRMIEGEQAKYR